MRYLIGGVLICLVTVSALGVIASRHESRQLFAELRQLERDRDELNEDWRRLKLEGGYWSSYDRISVEAQQQLGMHRPALEELVIAPGGD